MAPAGPPPAGGKPAKTGLIIVGVVAGLLLAAGGFMTYQWLSTSSELDDTRADLTSQIESLNTDVANRDTDIESLQGQLDDAQEENELLTQSLEGSEGEVERLQEANEAIDECLTQIFVYLDMVAAGAPASQVEDHIEDTVVPACDKADEYR